MQSGSSDSSLRRRSYDVRARVGAVCIPMVLGFSYFRVTSHRITCATSLSCNKSMRFWSSHVLLPMGPHSASLPAIMFVHSHTHHTHTGGGCGRFHGLRPRGVVLGGDVSDDSRRLAVAKVLNTIATHSVVQVDNEHLVHCNMVASTYIQVHCCASFQWVQQMPFRRPAKPFVARCVPECKTPAQHASSPTLGLRRIR